MCSCTDSTSLHKTWQSMLDKNPSACRLKTCFSGTGTTFEQELAQSHMHSKYAWFKDWPTNTECLTYCLGLHFCLFTIIIENIYSIHSPFHLEHLYTCSFLRLANQPIMGPQCNTPERLKLLVLESVQRYGNHSLQLLLAEKHLWMHSTPYLQVDGLQQEKKVSLLSAKTRNLSPQCTQTNQNWAGKDGV